MMSILSAAISAELVPSCAALLVIDNGNITNT